MTTTKRPTTVSMSRDLTLFFITLCLLTLIKTNLAYGTIRQHESHVHGAAKLNMALLDKGLYVELESPAINMVGFEHAPRNAQQKQITIDAEKKLKNGKALFIPSPKAGCRLEEFEVKHKALHQEQAVSEHHEHDHGHHHETGDHDEHGTEHKGHEGHSEYHALYKFECSAPNKLKRVDVMLFSIFPGLEKMEVQLLTPDGQTAHELTPNNHQVAW